MGGQTVRMLAQLLAHGTTGAPIGEDPSSHPLFKGGKSWVHSITTISTPNQGTTLGNGFSTIGDSVKDLLAGVLSVVGILGDSAKMVYDAKLDQWGITTKQSGESIQAYLDRVFSSRIFDPSFKDVCLWSLSTSGAKEEATPTTASSTRSLWAPMEWGRCYVRWSVSTRQMEQDAAAQSSRPPRCSRHYAAHAGAGSVQGHAALLYALPASSSSRRLADAPAAVAKLDTAIVELTAATTSVETKSDLESLCQSPKNSYAQSYCTKMLEAAPRVVYEDRRQRLRWKTVELCSPCVGLKYAVVSHATNTYPVVLVHGFGGWGRDELLGFKYWGGIQGDIQEELEALGYTVYTASIGPFSSNWDRACELYAQIKGGVRTTGCSLNQLRSLALRQKLHGSVSGATVWAVRPSECWLRCSKRAQPEPQLKKPPTRHLYLKGHDWIHSITTISTPNQGTTLADGFSEIGDTIKDLLVSIINVLGIFGDSVDLLYDAQLDQWGITAKQDDETLQEYFDRAFSSSIFDSSFKDVSIWSLSVAGAKEESMWVETLDDVYYYSYATKDTFSTYNWKLQKISYPNILTMLLPLDVLSIFLGSRYAPDTLSLTTDWQPNDGAVNTISMNQDYVGDIVEFDGSSVIGKWNQMTQLTGLDHLAVTGITLLYQIFGIYEAHAELLYSLPVGLSSSRRLVVANSTVATNLDSAISSLQQLLPASRPRKTLRRCAKTHQHVRRELLRQHVERHAGQRHDSNGQCYGGSCHEHIYQHGRKLTRMLRG
ncbi:Alpha/Beta hydrolase fold [Phytophthora cactorum]|nr:Alpha/Beta hydrolase fold [Phytophthora cactorum]